MECPVCSREFPLASIEEHVEKCLSTKSPETTKSKRTFPFDDSGKDPPQKKQKIQFMGESSKSSLMSFSSNEKNSASNGFHAPTEKKKPGNFSKTQKTSNSLINVATEAQKRRDHVPLAERLRPTTLDDYIGQKQLLGSKTVLGKLLDNKEIPSMILWGPPGCGKTSLATVIARMTKGNAEGKTKFVKLSATTSGIGDIREAVASAAKELKMGTRTIVFMDEIHRFNKLQQDIFLPHVEAGTFTLIGATTENPSFSLNSALLSRCRVFVLEKLNKDDMMEIIKKGLQSLSGDICGSNDFSRETNDTHSTPKFLIDETAAQWLAEACNGDARVALGGLEIAAKTIPAARNTEPCRLSAKDLKAGLEKTHTLAYRKCDLNYDLISAMQKSVRAGNANAALYWLARVMASGEDPVYIARRLMRIASEDVGLEDPEALDIAVHTMHACQMIGMPECDVMLTQCAVYLSRASKSRLIDDALRKAQKTIIEHKGPQPSVPLHIRDRGGERKLQASLGASRVHLVRKQEEGKNRLPAGLENMNFFY